MKKVFRLIAVVLSVMMLVSTMSFSTVSAATTNFKDVDAKNETLVKAVDLLNYMGVAKGVSDTEFGADELVTRQQFALFIYRMMKGGKDAPANGTNSTNFTDLVDPTYNYAISWAYQNGIISGRSATTFDPKGAITLQEAYAMVVRALEYEADGEKLSYPFGYIEVAEKETVNLPEGLPSSVDATDALTRGDMAIILYNAFFAEVGVAKVEYKERTLSDNSIVLVEEETYPRLCEKAFGVKEVEYQAVGTPHYSVADVSENTKDLGYDAIVFNRVDTDVNIKAPQLAYIAAKDLAIDADKLDDYFLATFTMFVTLDDDDNIQSVLFADSNMTKKTVDNIKFATVSTNKTTSYFDGTDAKMLSGKATMGADVVYFFNAPYSYVAPTYDAALTNEAKYELRNEENIGTLSVAVDNLEDGTFVATIDEIAIDSVYDDDDSDGLYAAEAEALASAFEQVYYGGLYEADIYDVDGDGIYDYIDYKPYTLFNVNTDKDYEFYDDGVEDDSALIPTVYTNNANILGKKFNDEDYVIGYYNKDANTIKVAEVIKPVTATIKSYKNAKKTITLTNGNTVSVDGAWKLVSNYVPSAMTGAVVYDVNEYDDFTLFNTLLSASAIGDDEIDLYIHDGIVLHQEGAKSSSLVFTEKLIIPTQNKDGDSVVSQFNTKLGEMVYYIYAWVDGDLKWVPVETEDVYPEIVDGGNVAVEYLNQLCTYSVDADGVYSITSLENNEDENGKPSGINYDNGVLQNESVLDDEEDEDVQWMVAGLNNVYVKKTVSKRFALVDSNGSKLNEVASDLLFTENSRVIVKNVKFAGTNKEEVEYVEYDINNFTTSSGVALNNVSVILSNNVDSKSRENLVVLYGEATDFDLKGTTSSTGYRIIANSDPNVDDDDYYRNYYTVYDPFTGKKTENVPGNYSTGNVSNLVSPVPNGSIVELKDGKVNDKTNAVLGNLNIHNTDGIQEIDNGDALAGMVWILEYDTSDKYILTTKVGGTSGCWNDANGENAEIYQIDKNTVVSMITYSGASNNNFVNRGTMKLLTPADLASSKNEYKCYNNKVEGSNGSYKTGYAKYIKAYVIADNDANLDDGEHNVAKAVIITVHGEEELTYLTTHTNAIHAKGTDC